MNIHPQNRIAWACLVCGDHGDRDLRARAVLEMFHLVANSISFKRNKKIAGPMEGL